MLSQRHLNRALLARQGLLEPFDQPLPQVLDRIGGIQAQYAPSMYVGLWSRMARLTRDELTDALERREVVQGTLLRGTIHLVPRHDYWVYALPIRESLRVWYDRAYKGDPPRAEIERAAARLRAALVERPLNQAEVDELAGKPARRWMNAYLDIVRVPPSGTWERRRADVYADAGAWLGGPDITAEVALRRLIRRYLTGFGPAAPNEIANWAGLTVTQVKQALAHIDHVTYEAEGGATLVDLPGAPLPDPDTPVPIRFLPTWDATLLVHARRTGILPEEHRPKIFGAKTPFSFPTLLVDGAVAGTWRYEHDRIDITEFDPLPRDVRRQVDKAAEELAEFHR